MTAPHDHHAGYRPRRTLTIGVELVRQLRRRRTMVAFGLSVALPLIVVAAVKLGPSSNEPGRGGFGDGDLDLVGLATAGAWNFTLTMLLFASGFLLHDHRRPVPAATAWPARRRGPRLRYLLAAPVPRRRLLRSKAIVGLLLTARDAHRARRRVLRHRGARVRYGTAHEPDRRHLHRRRVDHATGDRRRATSASPCCCRPGIAFLMSVLTDVPLGAVGAAVVHRHRRQHPRRDRGAGLHSAPAAGRVRERLGRRARHRGRLGDDGHRGRLQRRRVRRAHGGRRAPVRPQGHRVLTRGPAGLCASRTCRT